MLCYVMLCYVMYVMLCYVMYVMLCMLCYVCSVLLCYVCCAMYVIVSQITFICLRLIRGALAGSSRTARDNSLEFMLIVGIRIRVHSIDLIVFAHNMRGWVANLLVNVQVLTQSILHTGG
jgi:hypothetical protein